MKKLLILGSTGSIGDQALQIVAARTSSQVVGLAADSELGSGVEQAREHGVPAVALADDGAAERARPPGTARVLAARRASASWSPTPAPTSS